MSDTPNPSAPGAGSTRLSSHHDTVLLPEPAGAGAPESGRTSGSGPGSHPSGEALITNISQAALSALSQRYDILAEAGHGSMGNVYKARDRETGEIVALKLLKPEIASDQAMMERFKNELLFARRITHKNVCRVHDFNRIAGIAYTSMEFVNGESLRSVLTRFGGLPTRKAADIAQQICSGLKEAHAQGIVHRDLKPENVMIDAQGNVKIMDFGIARSMDMATRMTGSMVGTPAYMAPEQVAGKPVDYRTDIYSLGLVLYEVYTGVPAFHADTAVAVALKQLNEAPPPPHTIDPNFPPVIERAILRCLEKEPARRFSSVAELSKALGPSAPSGANAQAATPILTPHPAAQTIPPMTAATRGSGGSSGQVTNPFYSPHVTPPPPKRSTSPLAWILLGGILAVGALGAQKWIAQARSAELISPPPPNRALVPIPPDFALNPGGTSSPSQTSEAGTPSAPTTASPDNNSSRETSKPQGADGTPSSSGDNSALASALPASAPPAKASPTSATEKIGPAGSSGKAEAPSDVQRRAESAFKENQNSMAAFHAGTYLWVGRYDKKDKAEAAAKKIEDLGLPALVVPRQGLAEQFFIVLSGPFDTSRVSSVSEWLKDQGFPFVHQFKVPAGKTGVNP